MRSPSAHPTVVRWTIRRTWLGGFVVAATGVLVTVTAVQGYVAAYPDPADRLTLATSIGSNPGLTALFGETTALETVAGFTEWRVVLILALVGGVWALFASTRMVRGEEDAGRAEILLAGPLTRRGAAAACLLGLAGSVVLLAAVLVIGLVIGTGSDLGRGRAAVLGLTIAALPAVMAAVGSFTSQLADTRRGATAAGAGVLGVWYLLRVIADSSPELRWLRWSTPLGWLELTRPLLDPQPGPLLLCYLLAGGLGAATVALVRVRDVGVGLLGSHRPVRSRTALLGGSFGLAVRLARGAAGSWALGLGLFGTLIGLVARTAADAMAQPTGGAVLGQLDIDATGTRAYVGVSFVLVTLAVAVAAAGQVSATREEESSGRLDTLLVQPVDRARWLAGRLVVAVWVLAVAAGAAVAGTWFAGRLASLDIAATDLAVAGVNALPAAIFVLGAGTLVHAAAPQAAAAVTYGLVAWSFLLEIVGATVDLPPWLLGLSVLHHVAPAPAVDPDWRAAGVLALLGVTQAAAAALLVRRRDIASA